jgi:hypothetical protein
VSVALRNFAFEEFEAKLEHQRLSFLAAKLERERARVIHCCSHNTNPLSTHIYTQKDTKKFPPSLNTLSHWTTCHPASRYLILKEARVVNRSECRACRIRQWYTMHGHHHFTQCYTVRTVSSSVRSEPTADKGWLGVNSGSLIRPSMRLQIAFVPIHMTGILWTWRNTTRTLQLQTVLVCHIICERPLVYICVHLCIVVNRNV